MAIPKARVRQPRPDILEGQTYRIKPPDADAAWYITINNGTVDDKLRPVEIFVNSKDVLAHQWISALTRLLSAQLQQPGDFPAYAIKELKDTYDLMGGYFIPGGKGRVHSIVSHIGLILEEHCKKLNIDL